jgi:RND family efflux transporter MFP subunit
MVTAYNSSYFSIDIELATLLQYMTHLVLENKPNKLAATLRRMMTRGFVEASELGRRLLDFIRTHPMVGEYAMTKRIQVLVIAVSLSIFFFGEVARSEDAHEWRPAGSPPNVSRDAYDSGDIGQVGAVVINPHRSATIGSQVPGEIKEFRFDEGQWINKNEVVAVLDKRRYDLLLKRAEERLRAAEVALRKAEQDAQIKEDLFRLDSTTLQEVTRARTEAEIGRIHVDEATSERDLAKFELDSCEIKAPFSGHLAVRYKQADESVERSEKIFLLVDTTQLFAVANVSESEAKKYQQGKKVEFLKGTTVVEGTVDKTRKGVLFDPKSKTKRVFILLKNDGVDEKRRPEQLEIGMSGILRLSQ